MKSQEEASKKDEEDVDLFASDEEPVPAPAKVNPKNKKEVPKTVESPAFPNKSECNDAEAKFHAALSQNPGLLRNAANMERTFIMLKPDAVMRGLMGEIIERFETRGFKLVALKFMQADQELLQTHYSDLSKKGFFPELIRYMGSGPVVPMVFEGLNAVKQGRSMLGATNPKDSAPGTIRGDLCIDVGRNIIHGSDSVESANKEISLWFKPQELSQWRPCQVEWVYEEEELEPVDSLTSGLSKSK